MRDWLRSIIPSMFARRLLLVGSMLAAPMAALIAQVGRLGILEHHRLADAADAALIERRWIPAQRGRVLDRLGRVMAYDRPGFTVEVDYAVLDGSWAARTAASLAPRVNPDAWAAQDAKGRQAMTRALEARLSDHVSAMWDRIASLCGRDPAEVRAQVERTLRQVERAHDVVRGAARSRLLRERLASGLEVTDEARRAIESQSAAPIREQRAPHPIVADIPDAAGFELARLAESRLTLSPPGVVPPVAVPTLPGLRVTPSIDRVHPFDLATVRVDGRTLPAAMRTDDDIVLVVEQPAWHILGETRRGPRAEDIQARERALLDSPHRPEVYTPSGVDRGRYEPDDAVGHRGVERLAEHRLRGLRGVVERHRSTGDERTTPPLPGDDVRLTIDAALQARVAAALEPQLGLTRVQPWHGSTEADVGEVLSGAAVVLDIDTGDILAMVSTPAPRTIHTQAMAGDDTDPQPRGWSPDPIVNRAIAAAYPPGSIVKPLIAVEAVAHRRLSIGSGVVCSGHLLPDREDLYRCWIYKRFGVTHSPSGGALSVAESIKVSCNIFYYEMGRRLGVEGVADAYADFGLGTPFGLGLGPEWPGGLGQADGGGVLTRGLTTADAILMGIGQGPVSWTPLHAANAYATLARGGVLVPPRIIAGARPAPPTRLELDSAALTEALQGLSLSVNDPGGTGSTLDTGSGREPIFNVPGVDVWGKTGTATAPPILHDPDGPTGPAPARTVRQGDHAWFVVLTGPRGGRPTHAAAVIIEYGGSGGRVAGPVMNQLLHALRDQGYLEPGGAPPASPVAAAASGGRP